MRTTCSPGRWRCWACWSVPARWQRSRRKRPLAFLAGASRPPSRPARSTTRTSPWPMLPREHRPDAVGPAAAGAALGAARIPVPALSSSGVATADRCAAYIEFKQLNSFDQSAHISLRRLASKHVTVSVSEHRGDPLPLPTGDDLAAEVEQFLRDQE